MARIVRFPSETELPEGTVRDFAEILFRLYRMARRPALRDVSEKIRKNHELPSTASTETIRRMLRGGTVPRKWAIVETVYLTLCDIAGYDPDAEVTFKGEFASIRRHIETAWDRVLDDPDQHYRQPVTSGGTVDDPWADEPPF